MVGKFEELDKDMTIILTNMFSNQNLCKYLTVNTGDPLASADIADTTTLLMNNIFPTPIAPLPETGQISLINIVLDDMSMDRNTIAIKSSKIQFKIVCHIGLWQIPGTGATRPFKILNELDKTFNSQRLVGIGRTLFDSCRWMPINDRFQGYILSYKIDNLNTSW